MELSNLSPSFNSFVSISSVAAGRRPAGLENTELVETPFSPASPVPQTGASDDSVSRGTLDNSSARAQSASAAVAEGVESQRSTDTERAAEEQRLQDIQDREVIQELSARDREVRAHEQAHAAVGGNLTGAPSYDYVRGPDGVNYAVSGEVSISLRSDPDPEVTLEIARQARRAALAPAEPSAQDRAVAAQASQLELQAQQEIRVQEAEESRLDEEERVTEAAQSQPSSEEEPIEEVDLPFPPDSPLFSTRINQPDDNEQDRQPPVISNRVTDIISLLDPPAVGQLVSQSV